MPKSPQKMILSETPDPLAARDQHFCIDEHILDQMIEAAQITKTDIVLEIGAGNGNLTIKLVKKAKKIIAIENDQRFESILHQLDDRVEIIIGNALKILPKLNDFNKIVANIPYQICEPLMHFLCLSPSVTLSVLMVPKKFASSLVKHPIFSAFLVIKKIVEVPKEAFIPPPKVWSEVVLLTRRDDLDDDSFIRQKLYLQRSKLVKNGLRDALIDLYIKKHQHKLTKKKAIVIVNSLKLDSNLLTTSIARMHPKWYKIIGIKIQLISL